MTYTNRYNEVMCLFVPGNVTLEMSL